MPLVLAIMAAVALTALFGAAIERLFLRRVARGGVLKMIVTTTPGGMATVDLNARKTISYRIDNERVPVGKSETSRFATPNCRLSLRERMRLSRGERRSTCRRRGSLATPASFITGPTPASSIRCLASPAPDVLTSPPPKGPALAVLSARAAFEERAISGGSRGCAPFTRWTHHTSRGRGRSAIGGPKSRLTGASWPPRSKRGTR